MKRILLVAALGAVLSAGLAATASAEPTTVTTVQKLTFNETFANPCNGEPLLFLGSSYTFVTHITFDSSDPTFGTHFSQDTIVERSGIGLVTGSQYEGPFSGTGSLQDPRNPPFVLTTEYTGLIIGTGPLDDFFQRNQLHTTVNANGTTTTTFVNLETACKG